MGIRAIEKSVRASEKDYSINALEVIKEVFLHDLDKDERSRALSYLEKSNKSDVVVKSLRELLMSAKTIQFNDMSIPTKVRRLLQEKYIKYIRETRFATKVSNFFVVYAIYVLLSNIYYYARYYDGSSALPNMTFWDWGLLLSSIASGVFVLIGFMNRKRKGNLFGTPSNTT